MPRVLRIILCGVMGLLIGAVGLQAQPSTGLSFERPVVKVIAPGLVHFWRRLGFRRLYDIAVKMGWRDAARREEDINPWSIVD